MVIHPPNKLFSPIFLGGLCAAMVACAFLIALFGVFKGASRETGLTVKTISYSNLPGWSDETQPLEVDKALTAFQRSCAHIRKRQPDELFARRSKHNKIKALFGSVGDWHPLCDEAAKIPGMDGEAARAFFQTNFIPVLINNDPNNRGLFTGYYEPEMRGARVKSATAQTPLYRRPDDLVMVNLGDFRDSLEGQRIAGRVKSGRLSPYEDRAAIENGDIDENLALAWLNDPVDAFFLHIQGSGRILLPDGDSMRVGYDSQNGHPYTAIGRTLIDMGELTRENVSMQSIRQWLSDHPDRAQELMNENKSFVFFREIPVTDPELGPLGAQGVPLTPQASIAVDRRYYPMGAPIWVAFDEEPGLTSLMIAQDTGGAIAGVQRGDYFWGPGDAAAAKAGGMQAEGLMYALVPKALVAQW